MEKAVYISSGGYRLAGVFHIPDGSSGKVPVVIFCHGFAGTKVEAHRMFVKLARLLEQKGIASIRFDFRGCGDSSGEFVETTVMDEVEDTVNVAGYVFRNAIIEKTRVGIVGLSLGGAVASYASCRIPGVKALALWAPAADLEDEARAVMDRGGIQIIRRMNAVDYFGTLLGRGFIDEIPRIKPVDEIGNFKGSVLIIHGTDDQSVPLEHSLRYYTKLKQSGVDVRRILIPGADHVFNSYKWEQKVLGETLRFFLKRL